MIAVIIVLVVLLAVSLPLTWKLAIVKKNQEDEDDESDTFELPTNAPQGAIWPFDGKNYIRINDTWVQLTDDLISDKHP